MKGITGLFQFVHNQKPSDTSASKTHHSNTSLASTLPNSSLGSLGNINSFLDQLSQRSELQNIQEMRRTAWQITDIGKLEECQVCMGDWLKPEHARLKPVSIGLCGSDDRYVHQNPQTAPANRRRPQGYVVGHEVIARVLMVEEGNEAFSPGDLVAVNPHTKPLLPGKPGQRDNLIPGRNNFLATPMDAGALDTGFQHPTSRLVKLPKDVDLDVVTLAEPMACSLNAVMRLLKTFDPKCHPKKPDVNPLSNQIIVVQGAGSIGQNTAVLLANINAVMSHYKQMPRDEEGKGLREIFNRPIENLHILVTCVSEDHYENIENLFRNKTPEMIEHNIEVKPVYSDRDLKDLKRQPSGIYNCETYQGIIDSPYHDEAEPGAAAVIECSGAKTALEQSAQRVKPRGVIVHIARNQFDPAIAQRGEKQMLPTYRFKHKHFQQSVQMLTEGKLPQVKDMTLEHYRWGETPDAFDKLRRTANKRVIHCEPMSEAHLQKIYHELDGKKAIQREKYLSLLNAKNSQIKDIALELAQETGIEADLQTGQIRYASNFEPLSLQDEAGNPVPVVFVRHGKVPDNEEPRTFNGNIDRPSNQLSEIGINQANDAAAMIGSIQTPTGDADMIDDALDLLPSDQAFVQANGLPIDHIYTSPLKRAKDTARATLEVLANHPGSKLTLDSQLEENEGLREMSFGAADGRKLISVGASNPYHLLRSDQNALAKEVPERFNANNRSENFAEVILRANKALKSMKIPAGTRGIALFSHSMTGAAIRALFGRAPIVDGHIQFDGGKGMMKNATPYILSLGNR